MKRRDLLLQAGGAAWAAAVGAQEPDYPKAGATLRYVVPFPPGGLTDQMARLVGQQLATRWKVQVVVDNRAGGGGMIGADAVAKAPPDGATLLAVTLTHAVNATLFKGKAAYDFERDLRPVALLAASPMLVVVPANGPIKDFKDLMALSKKTPLNAGSSGNGTPPHLTLALFNELNKSGIQHVPYKGGPPSMTDLMGGQLDIVFSNMPESVAHVKGGRLRALAIASAQRHPLVPDVPTTAEAGMPQLLVENWTGLMVPAGMREAAVAKLSAEVMQILALHELQEQAAAQGFRLDRRDQTQFASFLASEIKRWAAVIQSASIRAE